jgi:hypothetical protein
MLHSEELCDVYISTGVVRVVKCRKLGWAGGVAGTNVMLRGEVRCDVYISTGVVREAKCRRVGWAGCVARMGVT